MDNGKLVIFSAPSGSGKTTIVRHLLATDALGLEFSISAASREPRDGEIDGKDYYFLKEEDFRKRIADSEFLEWEEVYKGNYYGTLRSEVERIWKLGKHVIFDIDVIGGLNLKKQFPERTLAVFVQPPSVEELRKRLEGRNTETEEKINMRIAKAEQELAYAKDFDRILVNDDLEDAKEIAFDWVEAFVK